MEALWIGPVSGELDQVLVSLQTRWPDARITPTALEPKLLSLLAEKDYQLVFIHLGRQNPKVFEVIQRLRQITTVPIVAVGNTSREEDRVKALYRGCDNLIDPASDPLEIQAILVAVLRRAQLTHRSVTAQEKILEFGPLLLYPERYQAYLSGQRLGLTPNEFRLLVVLVRQQGAIGCYDDLRQAMWEEPGLGSIKLVRDNIRRLREKLHQAAGPGCRILTVQSLGYRLACAAQPEGNPKSIPESARAKTSRGNVDSWLNPTGYSGLQSR